MVTCPRRAGRRRARQRPPRAVRKLGGGAVSCRLSVAHPGGCPEAVSWRRRCAHCRPRARRSRWTWRRRAVRPAGRGRVLAGRRQRAARRRTTRSPRSRCHRPPSAASAAAAADDDDATRADAEASEPPVRRRRAREPTRASGAPPPSGPPRRAARRSTSSSRDVGVQRYHQPGRHERAAGAKGALAVAVANGRVEVAVDKGGAEAGEGLVAALVHVDARRVGDVAAAADEELKRRVEGEGRRQVEGGRKTNDPVWCCSALVRRRMPSAMAASPRAASAAAALLVKAERARLPRGARMGGAAQRSPWPRTTVPRRGRRRCGTTCRRRQSPRSRCR